MGHGRPQQTSSTLLAPRPAVEGCGVHKPINLHSKAATFRVALRRQPGLEQPGTTGSPTDMPILRAADLAC
jgi:hypothetical protein